jgi:hypothetical protein
MATGYRIQQKSKATTAWLLTATLVACGQPAVEVPQTPAGMAGLPGVWAVSVELPEAAAAPAEPKPPLERGEAAKRGAAAGAKGSVVGGAMMAGAAFGDRDLAWLGPIVAGVFLVGGVVLAPVAALAGAAGGSIAGSSPERIAAAEASMQVALRERPSAADLAELFIREADQSAGRSLADCGAARTASACDLPDGTAPDILLVLAFGQPLFEIEGEIQPKLRLVQHLTAEIRPGDITMPSHARMWVYRGSRESYLELAADDARLLRQEFATARAALVAKAVDDLFLPGAPERHVGREQP